MNHSIKYGIYQIPTKEGKTFANKKAELVSELYEENDDKLQSLLQSFQETAYYDELISHYAIRSVKVEESLTVSQKKKLSIVQSIIQSLGFNLINNTKIEDFLHVSIDFKKFREDLQEARSFGMLNEIQIIKQNNRLIYALS